MPRGRKTFVEGEAVDVIRDSSHYLRPDEWEPATYVGETDFGWHRVDLDPSSPPIYFCTQTGIRVDAALAGDSNVKTTHRESVPARRIRKRKVRTMKHCDDYIDDDSAPEVLRVFLRRARSPAHGHLSGEPYPKLFADHAGQRVRVVMASRLGDVGITSDLEATRGYQWRVLVSELENFGDAP